MSTYPAKSKALLGLLILSACATPAKSPRPFDWQGHRGARGLFPENTIEGMHRALEYPVRTLELDVVITKDKRVVLSHEPWMEGEICLDPRGRPIRDKSHRIFHLEARALERYDCGSKPHPRFPQQQKKFAHKPLLADLVRAIEAAHPQRRIFYNVEIKSTPEAEAQALQPPYQEMSELVVAELLRLLPAQRFSIQSFDWRVLRYLHETHPQLTLVALREEAYEVTGVIRELGFRPQVFSPHFKLLTAQQVRELQGLGIRVIPWTVNTLEDLRAVKALGVDGIITDYPDRIGAVKND